MPLSVALRSAQPAAGPMVETIGPADLPFALLLRPPRTDGTHFLTPPELELQVGQLQHRRGVHLRTHRHCARPRQTDGVAEVLVVQHGVIELKVYDAHWQPLATVQLVAGEIAMLLRGGHSVTVLEDARVLEVRQGPFPGTAADKVYPDAG